MIDAPMLGDSRNDLFTIDPAIVPLLGDAIDAYLGARADTRARLTAVLNAAPHCVMAHCLDGYFSMLACRGDSATNAKAAWIRGEAASERFGASERERRHLDALRRWIAGDMRGAADAWDFVLRDYPRDIVALKVSQFVLSYLGESARMLATVERVLPSWNAELRGYGFLIGCHAYALEETGAYAHAENTGRRAVDLNRSDIWAAHAVAHVREMQGRSREGLQWIASLADAWTECSSFALHLRWHEGLYHLDLENYDRVLELYDREIRANGAREYLDVANAVSLLWRLEQSEVSVGARWKELASLAAGRLNDHALVFVDMHYLIALAAAEDDAGVEAFMASCRQFAVAGDGTEARVMSALGIPLARALIAHRRGDYAEVVQELLPVHRRVIEIGGSHAQRDVFDQLLIDASWRAGRLDLATSLLDSRISARPANLWGLKHRAIVLEAQSASHEATAAWRELDRARALQVG